MSDTPKQNDWSKPAAMAIPKRNTSRLEQGRYGPIFPKTPACYGFSIIAKLIPGREPAVYEHARKIEKAVAEQPDCLAVLKLHYLRWQLFTINEETYFQYQGIFDTDFDKYTEDAVALFSATGILTVFENLEGFPKDWKTNPAGVRQVCPRPPPTELSRIRGIPVRERRGDQEGAQGEDGVLQHARPDAVIGTYEVNPTTVDEERNDEDEHDRSDGEQCASTSMPSTKVTRRRWRRLSLSRGRSLTAWRRTCGRGQQPLRIGTETCWLKVSNMVLQTISSLWASRCTTTSPATARMWLFPRP